LTLAQGAEFFAGAKGEMSAHGKEIFRRKSGTDPASPPDLSSEAVETD
jgi:hypothetical protein